MLQTTFVLRIKEADGSYSVGAMDLPSGTTVEQAIEIALEEVQEPRRIERITNADNPRASLTLSSVKSRAPRGFGS